MLNFTWSLPTLDLDNELEIIEYRVYGDKGYLLEGSFELLASINSYEHNYHVQYSLTSGVYYSF